MKAMEIQTAIARGFSRWIDAVAECSATLLNRFSSSRSFKLVERDANAFDFLAPDGRSIAPPVQIVDGQIVDTLPESVATMVRGSMIDIILKPDRFLFCPIELPRRAAEYLDGIIRSQIDRLTPWNDAAAAFGWSKPSPAGADRIVVTVAATDRTLVAPYVRAVTNLGVQSIAVYTRAGRRSGDDFIKVMEEKTARFVEIGRIRQTLIAILAAAIAITVATGVGSRIVQTNLNGQQAELDFRMAKFRAAAGASNGNLSTSLAAAQLNLEDRKQNIAPTVIILETLSRILPDDTYVTELRIEDNKLKLEGVTRNAPSLIKLLEQSGQFTRATFFGPTTRSPSDAVERFHIEAFIQLRTVARS
jgi:general secretion pathway protein L